MSAVHNNGIEEAYVGTPSTSTLVNSPLTAVSSFSAVAVTSFTAVWDNNLNPLSFTEYNVEASTAANFNVGVTNKVIASTNPVAGPS